MQLPNLVRRVLSFLSFRRAEKRKRAEVAVDWRVFGSTVHRVSATGDLSSGGAFVRTDEPKAIDTPLVLELGTTGGRVEVHGRVAWRGPAGMGVRFMRGLGGGRLSRRTSQ